MAGVAPPPPVAPAGTGSSGAGAASQAASPAPQAVGEVEIEQLPQRLAHLTRPAVLTGTPTGETAGGLVRLRTPMGEIVLRTTVPLPADRPVTLQIPAGNPPTRAQAFVALQAPPVQGQAVQGQAVQGQAAPPQIPQAQIPQAQGLQPPAGQAAAQPPPQAPLRPGTVVAATIVAAAQPPVTQPAAAPATPSHHVPPGAPPGAAASAAAAYGARAAAPQAPAPQASPTAPPPAATVPEGTQAPARGAAPPPSSPPPSSPPPATPARAAMPAAGAAPAPLPVPVRPQPLSQAPQASPAPAPIQPSTQPATPASTLPASGLRQGAPVDLHVLRLPGAAAGSSGAAAPAPAAPPPPGPVLQAVVTGTSPGGQTILASGNGPLVVQARAVLPPGTVVAIALPAAPPPAAFSPLHGGEWPSLRHALDALAQADPGGTRALMSAVLPQAGPRLAGAIAHFTGAVRQGGDARRWIGERAAQALETTNRKAMSALEDDFKTLSRQAAEPLPGDWRAYSLPFSDGQAIARIQLFVRRSDDEETDGTERSGGKARRFLIDVDLSALGKMQFDGLVRDKRFDLILRTRDVLPAEIRQDVQNLFTVTLDGLGLTGSASFQGGGEGWVVVPPSPGAAGAGGERGLIA
ncbi:hypothetical protein [Arenibaculum sp.]|jgi:hypothetical protein|uniref:hypothetical protein n=1 Tax=Arenibaculum sp. TaxID=2865862 RepID=UPI002E0F45EC|nr:hypothetical protein [Arenibaculum sp.]